MNRSIVELNKTKLSSPSCVHTKHIYSLLDMPTNEESAISLNKHLETCSVCHKEFQLFKLKTEAARVFIPKVIMDRDLRQSFEREVVELFKVMNLNERELLKKNVKKGFRQLDTMTLDFIKNLSSKTMLKTYFFAGVLFLCMKFFL